MMRRFSRFDSSRDLTLSRSSSISSRQASTCVSGLTAAPPSAILLGRSCLHPLRGQSSLHLCDAPVLVENVPDQGRDERDREHRRLLVAALERIPELEAPSEPRESPESPADMGEGVEARFLASPVWRIASRPDIGSGVL